MTLFEAKKKKNWRFCLFYSYKQCHSIYENYQIKIKFIYSFIFFFVKLQNPKKQAYFAYPIDETLQKKNFGKIYQ